MSETTNKARALLAAATSGPDAWRVDRNEDGAYISEASNGDPRYRTTICQLGHAEWDERNAALIAAAPTLIATLCDEADAAELRAEEAEAGAAAMREAAQDVIDEAARVAGLGYDTRWLLTKRVPALKTALANPAGRTILERLERAESERDEARRGVEQVSDLCEATTDRAMAAENAQFAAEAERDANRTAAENAYAAQIAAESERGLAIGQRDAAFANLAEREAMLDNQNAGLVQMARERDALRADVEATRIERDFADMECDRLRAQIDADRETITRLAETVGRMEGRKAVVCIDCGGTGSKRPNVGSTILYPPGTHCDKCGGSGAVIVKGDK